MYAYLVLFGLVYPAERNLVPRAVMTELAARLAAEEAGEWTRAIEAGDAEQVVAPVNGPRSSDG